MPLKLPKPKMILLSAAGLTVVYFGGCYLMARNYISPIRFATTDRPPFLAEATIANGKYDIPVWQTRGLSSDNPKQDVFIMVHGYGGDRSVWNNLAAQFEHSAEIVIPATMGQTESPAPRVGFGLGESDEILTIATWVKSKNPASRIHLVGVSMGGSACWIAAGKHPELFESVISGGGFCPSRLGDR
ncbi:alpha/beta fold hydrolase [Geitlerinema splendidum]|nr:alpha/beta fold hydrolase [Geitlerinema splendidum]